jgi:RNA polymerase sigma-70 factor, ECF subfamily
VQSEVTLCSGVGLTRGCHLALRADDVDLGRDSLLVARFQAGDSDAFDDLYRRYFARLRRFCQRRVGDPNEAEELAQEAFVRALRAMPTLVGERRFYPWMTVIASRLCVDAHRRRGRSQPVADVDPGTIDADLSGPEAEVDRAHLAQAMDRVAPRHREVLELREIDGWSYQRIADHYGVTLGTVEALLHRARRALRREFLSVAGDTPAWAAIPFAGLIARRVANARAKLAALGGDIAPYATPLASVVASVAVTVGAVAVLDSPAAAGRTARQQAVHAAVASVATEIVTAVPAVVPATSDTAARASAPDAVAEEAPATGSLEDIVVDRRRAQEHNTNSEVVAQLPVLSVGVNPTTIASDVDEFIDNVLERLP